MNPYVRFLVLVVVGTAGLGAVHFYWILTATGYSSALARNTTSSPVPWLQILCVSVIVSMAIPTICVGAEFLRATRSWKETSEILKRDLYKHLFMTSLATPWVGYLTFPVDHKLVSIVYGLTDTLPYVVVGLLHYGVNVLHVSIITKRLRPDRLLERMPERSQQQGQPHA